MLNKFMKFSQKNEVFKTILFSFSLSTAMIYIFWNLRYGRGYLCASNKEFIINCLSLMLVNFFFSAFFSFFFIFFNHSKKNVLNFIGIAFIFTLIFIFSSEIFLMLTFDRTTYFNSKKYWKIIHCIFFFLAIFFVIKRESCYKTFRKIGIILFPLTFFFHFSLIKDISTVCYHNQIKLNDDTCNKARVLLLIFDEMDQYLAFSNRPSFLKLDELDNFKNSSFNAQNAYSPTEWTLSSIPSYLYGKQINSAIIYDHDTLSCRLNNGKKIIFNKKSDNIFSDLLNLNINTALIGWYHPYNRLVKDVNYCFSFGKDCFIYNFYSILENTINFYISSINKSLPKISLMKKINSTGINIYQNILNKTLMFSSNANINFIFSHFSIPHAPSIYNLNNESIEHNQKSYLGNLKLVDLTLSKIKQKMIKNNLWDSTTVIITSDHFFRNYHVDNLNEFNDEELNFLKNLQRAPLIPCLIKFAKCNQAYKYEKKFNTIILHDLIPLILSEKITNPVQLASYIDEHSEDYLK